MLTNEQKEKIKVEFSKKVPTLKCPMCQKNGFTMADGYFFNSIQTDLKSVNVGGPAIPTIAVICNNCGFVSQHALGTLGLLKKNAEDKTDEPK